MNLIHIKILSAKTQKEIEAIALSPDCPGRILPALNLYEILVTGTYSFISFPTSVGANGTVPQKEECMSQFKPEKAQPNEL